MDNIYKYLYSIYYLLFLYLDDLFRLDIFVELTYKNGRLTIFVAYIIPYTCSFFIQFFSGPNTKNQYGKPI